MTDCKRKKRAYQDWTQESWFSVAPDTHSSMPPLRTQGQAATGLMARAVAPGIALFSAETSLSEVSYYLTRELEAIGRFENVTDYPSYSRISSDHLMISVPSTRRMNLH